ncbi:zinc-binding protein A33-like [Aplochiton taeniatus]
MAEGAWNEEMAEVEGPFLLQEDLTCPVCRDLFNDPVLLSCSHSFCKECLNKAWLQGVNKCPVCRKNCKGETPIPNRALNSACESFQKEKGWRTPSVASPDNHCNIHNLELQLYCIKDEEPVCVECVTLHRTHELLPLNKGAPYCKEELNIKVNILEEKVELYKKMKNKFTNTVQFIKSQAGQAEKLIKAEFERLHNVLYTEEALRLKALADEEEDKSVTMEDKISTLTRELVILTDLIQTLKREMGGEDLDFLKNFQKLKTKAQWPKDDPEYPKNCLLNMGKHVGSLGSNIWKKMQSHVSLFPVVLDPNTASPWLSMNPQLTSIQEGLEREVFPDNSERFDPCVFVLGAEGFTSGKHRWEVLVGDNPKWILGVCKEGLARKRKFTLSTERGAWTIGLSKGTYNALTPKRTVLKVERRPEKIRVKLNMDKGEVSFWDAGNGKHLCTFTHQFTEKVFPLFGPGLCSTPMVVAPAKMSVHTT